MNERPIILETLVYGLKGGGEGVSNVLIPNKRTFEGYQIPPSPIYPNAVLPQSPRKSKALYLVPGQSYRQYPLGDKDMHVNDGDIFSLPMYVPSLI